MNPDRWLEGFPRPLLSEAFHLWSSGQIHWRPGEEDVLLVRLSSKSHLRRSAHVSREMIWRRPGTVGTSSLEALRVKG
ncbi:MAG: hypothetical protein ACK4OK_07465, partial [Thermoflexus sp.]